MACFGDAFFLLLTNCNPMRFRKKMCHGFLCFVLEGNGNMMDWAFGFARNGGRPEIH